MTFSSVESVIERNALGADATRALAGAATEIATWAPGSHVWGHYAESTGAGPVICRTENVSACHPVVAALVTGSLRALAAERLGGPAADFKDKINYKQPGGAGFRPHQDAVAYPGVPRVVSILVAIDACTRASGCLWLASGVDEVLPVDDRGVVRADVCASLAWDAAELEPGDAVVLDGFVPHYSDVNGTDRARRVLVASYTRADAGYDRATYYERRAAVMTASSERDGRFRISTLADFAGAEVAAEAPAGGACTHPDART
jgi:hypothetical protein